MEQTTHYRNIIQKLVRIAVCLHTPFCVPTHAMEEYRNLDEEIKQSLPHDVRAKKIKLDPSLTQNSKPNAKRRRVAPAIIQTAGFGLIAPDPRLEPSAPQPLHPLFCAAQQDDIVTLCQLLEADPGLAHLCDNNGGTALHHAAQSGSACCMAPLLSFRANPTLLDISGNAPAHLATARNKHRTLQALLQAVQYQYQFSSSRYGCAVIANQTNTAGQTPLHLAAQFSRPAIDTLLASGANPHLENLQKKTAAHLLFEHATNWFGFKEFAQPLHPADITRLWETREMGTLLTRSMLPNAHATLRDEDGYSIYDRLAQYLQTRDTSGVNADIRTRQVYALNPASAELAASERFWPPLPDAADLEQLLQQQLERDTSSRAAELEMRMREIQDQHIEQKRQITSTPIVSRHLMQVNGPKIFTATTPTNQSETTSDTLGHADRSDLMSEQSAVAPTILTPDTSGIMAEETWPALPTVEKPDPTIAITSAISSIQRSGLSLTQSSSEKTQQTAVAAIPSKPTTPAHDVAHQPVIPTESAVWQKQSKCHHTQARERKRYRRRKQHNEKRTIASALAWQEKLTFCQKEEENIRQSLARDWCSLFKTEYHERLQAAAHARRRAKEEEQARRHAERVAKPGPTHQHTEQSRALFDAAGSGNLTSLLSLLHGESRLAHTKNKHGQLALHYAATRGHAECVQALIIAGAPVCSVDKDGNTPLHYAALGNHPECVRILQTAPQEILPLLKTNREGKTPLDLALHKSEALAVLVAACLEHHLLPTKLLQATANGNTGIVLRTLSRAARYPGNNPTGLSPLHIAAYDNNHGLIALICKAQPELSDQYVIARDVTGKIPLHYAAERDNLQAVEMLLQNTYVHKQLTTEDAAGHRPLQSAPVGSASHALLEAVFALEHHVDTADSDDTNHTPTMKALIEESAPLHPLHMAAYYNHVPLIEKIIQIIPNSPILRSGTTPLHFAAACNNLDTAAYLIDNGVDINARSSCARKCTALHLAAHDGRIEMTRLLLSSGASARVPGADGNTALHRAVLSGNALLVGILLAQPGVAEDASSAATTSGFTPLHFAAMKGNTHVTQTLLDAGADPNITSKISGLTPLHCAAGEGHIDTTALLLKYGANRHIRDLKTGRTPAEFITQRSAVSTEAGCDEGEKRCLRNKKALLALLHNAQNITTAQDSSKKSIHYISPLTGKVTPLKQEQHTDSSNLHEAAARGNCEQLVALLTGAGPDATELALQRDSQGRTALHCAAEAGNGQTAYLLLRHAHFEPQVMASDSHGRKPADINNNRELQYYLFSVTAIAMTEQQQPAHIRNLLNRALPNPANPIYKAAALGINSAIRTMLRNGYNEELFADQSSSPHHIAAAFGQTKTLQLLIEMGADANKVDETPLKRTPIQYAANCFRPESVKTLLELGASVSTKCSGGITTLHIAAKQGDLKSIQILLAHPDTRTILDTQDENGTTALHYVVQTGHIAIAKALLDAGANPNLQATTGVTPLMIAVDQNLFDIVKLLLSHGANSLIEDEVRTTAIRLVKTTGEPLRNGTTLMDARQIRTLLLGDMAKRQKNTKQILTQAKHMAITVSQDKSEKPPASKAHVLAAQGNCMQLQELLANNPKVLELVMCTNTTDQIPLHVAAAANQTQAVRTLIQSAPFCPQILARDSNGQTANELATDSTIKSYLENIKKIAEAMLQQHDSSAACHLFPTNEVHHPIYVAAALGMDREAKSLLTIADVTAIKQEDSTTPLHTAAAFGQCKMLRILIQHGMPINQIEAGRKCTPLHIAIGRQQTAAAITLLELGAAIHITNDIGSTPLHVAAAHGNLDAVTKILTRDNAQSILEATCMGGMTALHLAAKSGCIPVVNVLLDAGANINAQTSDGVTPLFIAASESLPHMVKLLLSRGADCLLANNENMLPIQVIPKQSAPHRAGTTPEDALQVTALLTKAMAKQNVHYPALPQSLIIA